MVMSLESPPPIRIMNTSNKKVLHFRDEQQNFPLNHQKTALFAHARSLSIDNTDPAGRFVPVRGKLIFTHALMWISVFLMIARYAIFVARMIIRVLISCVIGQGICSLRENPMLGPPAIALLKIGALKTTNIRAGEGWRLLWAPFLHAGWFHVGMNFTLWYKLGVMIEPDWGFLRTTFVFMVAAVSGNIMSATLDTVSISVGASGGIFGIMGGCIPYIIEYWHTIPQPKCMLWIVLTSLIVGLACGFMPYVDNYAHIGGAIGGILAGFMTIHKIEMGRRPPLPNSKSILMRRFRTMRTNNNNDSYSVKLFNDGTRRITKCHTTRSHQNCRPSDASSSSDSERQFRNDTTTDNVIDFRDPSTEVHDRSSLAAPTTTTTTIRRTTTEASSKSSMHKQQEEENGGLVKRLRHSMTYGGTKRNSDSNLSKVKSFHLIYNSSAADSNSNMDGKKCQLISNQQTSTNSDLVRLAANNHRDSTIRNTDDESPLLLPKSKSLILQHLHFEEEKPRSIADLTTTTTTIDGNYFDHSPDEEVKKKELSKFQNVSSTGALLPQGFHRVLTKTPEQDHLASQSTAKTTIQQTTSFNSNQTTTATIVPNMTSPPPDQVAIKKGEKQKTTKQSAGIQSKLVTIARSLKKKFDYTPREHSLYDRIPSRTTIRATDRLDIDDSFRWNDPLVWFVRITALFLLVIFLSPLLYFLFICPTCYTPPGQLVRAHPSSKRNLSPSASDRLQAGLKTISSNDIEDIGTLPPPPSIEDSINSSTESIDRLLLQSMKNENLMTSGNAEWNFQPLAFVNADDSQKKLQIKF